MCGISGIITKREIRQKTIKSVLNLMKNRGPDYQKFEKLRFNNCNFYIFSSRLKIIDLSDRSNMPFKKNEVILIFNGEIYNYLELKKILKSKGCKFKTTSDTEVLLEAYKVYGLNFTDYIEGMWSCCFYDKNKERIILSRDRFGEKPLYYQRKNNEFIFGSEINYIKELCDNNIQIDYRKIETFLECGHKSIYKNKDFFFKDIKILDSGSHLIINDIQTIRNHKYWKFNHKFNKNISEKEIINETRRLLIKSVKTKTRSDVHISFCLGGGIDSPGLLSIIKKELNIKIKTFSIINKDKRYDERKIIDKINKHYECDHEYIYPTNKNFLDNLINLIQYHSKPLSTISSYIYSLLMKSINRSNFKVTLTGNVADEIFAGYYDHTLLHLNEVSKEVNFLSYLNDWKKNIQKNILNRDFKNPYLFIENKDFRKHVFDKSDILKKILIKNKKNNFFEKKYSNNLMSNRMLNEIFHETTPVILLDADHNSMKYSIENRNPYVDKEIFNFLFSIPRKKLINKGYNKFILRQALDGYLDDSIRLRREKIGFNSNIFNFLNKENTDFLLNQKSEIYKIVNFQKFKNLVISKKKDNYISKFIFNVLNAKIFLELI